MTEALQQISVRKFESIKRSSNNTSLVASKSTVEFVSSRSDELSKSALCSFSNMLMGATFLVPDIVNVNLRKYLKMRSYFHCEIFIV